MKRRWVVEGEAVKEKGKRRKRRWKEFLDVTENGEENILRKIYKQGKR